MHREGADAAFLLQDQDAKEEQHLPCNYAYWRCFLQNPLRGCNCSCSHMHTGRFSPELPYCSTVWEDSS